METSWRSFTYSLLAGLSDMFQGRNVTNAANSFEQYVNVYLILPQDDKCTFMSGCFLLRLHPADVWVRMCSLLHPPFSW